MITGLPFYILSVLSIFSALMVVISKKPVHSVLYLIFCFATIGGHYILLNAQFLFAVHIIVYAGAIMVLFLYALMFINMNKEAEPNKSNLLKISATICSGILLLLIVAATKDVAVATGGSSIVDIGSVKNLGKVLYGKYLLPFELTSILLLAAMVGAVMLGKREIK